MVLFNPPAKGFGNSRFNDALPDIMVPKLCTHGVLVSFVYITMSLTFPVTSAVTGG